MTAIDPPGSAPAPAGSAPGRPVAALGLLLAVAVAALLTAVVGAGGEVLAGFDQALTDFTRDWADALGWPVDLAHAIGLFTGPGWSTVYAAVVVVVLLFAGHPAASGFVALSAIVGVAVTEGVKLIVGRARPPGAEQFESDLDKSFPSGHSSAGIYLYLVLGLVLLHLGRANGRRWLDVVGSVLVLIGPMIGLTRLVLGVHWPSDIIGGWAYGSSAALLAALVFWRPLSAGWADPVPPGAPVADPPHPGHR